METSMETSQSILVIVNHLLTEDINALQFFAKSGPQTPINLAYIIPVIPATFWQIPSMKNEIDKFYQHAGKRLTEVGRILDIHPPQHYVKEGTPSTLRLADTLNAKIILTSQPQLFKSAPWMERFFYSIPQCKPTEFFATNKGRVAVKSSASLELLHNMHSLGDEAVR